MTLLPSMPSRFAWTVLLVAAVITVVSGVVQGFSIALGTFAMTLPLVGILLAGSVVYSGPRPMPGVAKTMALLAYLILTGLVLGPMSYIMASLNFPLVDETLAQLDRLIGFDWRWLQRVTANSTWASFAAFWVYSMSGIQFILALTMLCWLQQEQRLNQLLSGFVLATMLTLLIAAVMPAAGGYAHYGLSVADYGYVNGGGPGVSYLDQFHAVRMGSLRRLGVEPPEGITQFPSFHTVLALVSGWATWRLGWIGPINAAYAGIVILTTLPIGGHHLMDLLGAVVVVMLSLGLAGRVEGAVETGNVKVPELVEPLRWQPA